jgi:hypothetical protein
MLEFIQRDGSGIKFNSNWFLSRIITGFILFGLFE